VNQHQRAVQVPWSCNPHTRKLPLTNHLSEAGASGPGVRTVRVTVTFDLVTRSVCDGSQVLVLEL
jgi:hypothetical protein